MDVTKQCSIAGKQGFDLANANRYVAVEVKAKSGDQISVNKIKGIKYNEIWTAYEHPKHQDHPVIDLENKIIYVGGKNEESKRTICVIGK